MPPWSYPNALTHTWPVPELTPVCHRPVTPGASAISPSVPSRTIARPAVVPYLPVDVLAAKGPASTADYTSPALRQDAHIRHALAECSARRCWGLGSSGGRC